MRPASSVGRALGGSPLRFVLALAAVLPILSPGVTPRIKWYDVTGSTAAELRRALDQLGPVGDGGERFDAHTDWTVNWSYRFMQAPDRCALTSVSTSLSITTTLPRWVAGREEGSALARQWDAYLKALTLHEEGHAAIGRRAAAAVDATVSGLPSEMRCAQLEMAIAAAAEERLESARREERKYDEVTRHGATSGVVFP